MNNKMKPDILNKSVDRLYKLINDLELSEKRQYFHVIKKEFLHIYNKNIEFDKLTPMRLMIMHRLNVHYRFIPLEQFGSELPF